MPLSVWLAASMVLTLAATLQGAVGFGMALVAAPFLALIDARLVPGPLIVTSTLLTILLSVRERDGMDGRAIGIALIGRVPGSLLGGLVLASVSRRDLGLLFGALILAGTALLAWSPPIRPTPAALTVAGFVSGIMGTSSGIGGPPMALLYQNEPGPRMRGTLAGYFTLGAVVSLIVLVRSGLFGLDELGDAAALCPPVLLGHALSKRAALWLDAGRTRLAVLTTTALAGTLLIVLRFVGR